MYIILQILQTYSAWFFIERELLWNLLKQFNKLYSAYNLNCRWSVFYQMRRYRGKRSSGLIASLCKGNYACWAGSDAWCFLHDAWCTMQVVRKYATRGVIVGWECRAWGCDPRLWPDLRVTPQSAFLHNSPFLRIRSPR